MSIVQIGGTTAREGGRVDAVSTLRRSILVTWRALRVALLWSPSLFAIVYYGVVASDRYVSEGQFVIRTASKPLGGAGFGSFLQMAGLSRSQDDVFTVQGFLASRDATRLLSERLPLQTYFGVADADAIARYPSVFYGQTFDEFHKYLNRMVSTVYSSNTGLTTLRVEAFKPDHAKAIAANMLDLGEQMVNRMNARIHDDAVRLATNEVKLNEDRLVAAQIAITRFRNDELTIDPASSSVIVTELIARLSEELTHAQTQLREASASAPDGPMVTTLRRRIVALDTQIADERRKISGEGSGLAKKLAEYERLVLNREFAKTGLATAVRSLDVANTEARRQQLYLERVVEPAAADYPLAPERLRTILTVLLGNGLALLVLWLTYAGVHERASEQQH